MIYVLFRCVPCSWARQFLAIRGAASQALRAVVTLKPMQFSNQRTYHQNFDEHVLLEVNVAQ